jgi:hypothetical protein
MRYIDRLELSRDVDTATIQSRTIFVSLSPRILQLPLIICEAYMHSLTRIVQPQG